MKPRVYYLKAPPPGWVPVLLAAWGLVISGYALFTIFALSVRSRMLVVGSNIVFVFLLICVGLGLWMVWLANRIRRQARAGPKNRLSRLEALMARPEGARRFPHRALERSFRRSRISERAGKLAERLADCPSGSIFCVNVPPSTELPPPRASTVPFEPVALDDDVQHRELLRMGYGEALPEPLLPELKRAYRNRMALAVAYLKAARHLPLKILIGAFVLYIFVIAPYFSLRAALQGDWWGATQFVFYMVPILLILHALLYPTRTWLIPGALLIHKRGLFGRHERITLCRLVECVFLYRPYVLQVVTPDRKIHTFGTNLGMTTRQFHAVLCALFNRATPPTTEEIQEFLEGRQ